MSYLTAVSELIPVCAASLAAGVGWMVSRRPEYIEVVVSTSNAQTGEFLIVQITSIRLIRRTASSFKPKLGRFLRHSSPNGFP